MLNPMNPIMGQFHTMNALNAAPNQAPHQIANGMLGPQNASGQFPDIMSALQGAHDVRMASRDNRMAMGGQMNNYLHHGMRPHQPGSPVPMPPQINPGTQGPPVGGIPQMPNTQFPLNPYPPQNMVGQSYAVQGMTPASNPYGLPTY